MAVDLPPRNDYASSSCLEDLSLFKNKTEIHNNCNSDYKSVSEIKKCDIDLLIWLLSS